MRECGECTLCCKIPMIPGFKPSNQWCKHVCEVGCKIYADRPSACEQFMCQWLRDPTIPEDYRPDKVHLYVVGDAGEDVLKIMVDTEHPDAWKKSSLVEGFREQGKHVLVACGRQVTFLAGYGLPAPEKIILDWVL